ncbi:multiheme c-type cytochrome [Kosmotoga pacifica]|uniref:Cytochrome c-552/4 domain-containing protein n=1 Tax=Kosmotoga pacifica TaxID=1330330 RepID=A0A0G2ZBR0_9BACT|nr:multiheme c-type cytochrome [Kosmotoga pacifica]AKI97511.1 hypothetical protein IX53_06425 [Kosmotoga pacifica]
MRALLLVVFFSLLFCITIASEYVGSETCFQCHPGKYNDWKVSGHPYKLRPAEIAKYAPLPLPRGYSWDDVSYVIGGYKWKARYIDKEGYIITTLKDGTKGENQYNMMTGEWVDYHPGEKKAYSCGACHTTGYSSEGHQDNLPGVVGTWEFGGIGCEACHGPGYEHVASGGEVKPVVEEDSSLCGQCHVRGDPNTIPASKGFIRHHEQYNEMMASPHADVLNCVTCHDPHKRAEFSIKYDCATCHGNEAEAFEKTEMAQVGVDCIDCHMPKASKSAVAFGPYEADIRSHLCEINTDPEARMFSEDGKFANSFITLDFACLTCHSNKDIFWAAEYAKDFHKK